MNDLSFGISGSALTGSSLPPVRRRKIQRNRDSKTRRDMVSSNFMSKSTKNTHLKTTKNTNEYRRPGLKVNLNIKNAGNTATAASAKNVTKSRYGSRRQKPNSPISMQRAKFWTAEVEEAYRIQGSGWRSIQEYRRVHGDPQRWENGFVRVTVHPKTGYFMYWSKERQCAEGYLSKVKLFKYANEPVAAISGEKAEASTAQLPQQQLNQQHVTDRPQQQKTTLQNDRRSLASIDF